MKKTSRRVGVAGSRRRASLLPATDSISLQFAFRQPDQAQKLQCHGGMSMIESNSSSGRARSTAWMIGVNVSIGALLLSGDERNGRNPFVLLGLLLARRVGQASTCRGLAGRVLVLEYRLVLASPVHPSSDVADHLHDRDQPSLCSPPKGRSSQTAESRGPEWSGRDMSPAGVLDFSDVS
jgi:hypothetical protein